MELTPVQKVFSLPELVSLILEFLASGQPRNYILQLRTVCQLWRRMAFKTLNTNKIVAEIFTRHLSGFYDANNTFRPDCYIPIELSATNRDLENYDIQFIQKYAHCLVSLKVLDVDVVRLLHPPLDIFTVDLPHLKHMEIRIPNYIQFSAQNPLHRLILNLAENATRLKTLDLTVTLWKGDTLPSNLLRKITNLSVNISNYTSLEHLLQENNLPKLSSLHLLTTSVPDSEVFTRIAIKISAQLKSFSFPANNTSRFSDIIRKQKFGVLERLELLGRIDNTPTNVLQQISGIDTNIPTLTQLVLPILSAPAAEKVLPLIFSKMTRLTTLSVSISNTLLRSEDYEIGRLLTGLDAVHGFETEDIDKDSPLWPSFLEGSQQSITNLKNLREFKLEVELFNGNVVCCIPRFVFRAGFFQMRNLAKITLVNILMNPTLFKNYVEETGRQLILQNTRTRYERAMHYETDSVSDSDSDG